MKKTILLIASFAMTYSIHAQDISFDNLKSNAGFGKTVELGSYHTRSGISAYRFINQQTPLGQRPVLSLQARSENPLDIGWKDRVTLNNDNLGIGTLYPTEKLHVIGNAIISSKLGIGTQNFNDDGLTYHLSVNGRVRADAVKVYTDWADYVFEADYNLPTLEEVESYINENGHLKDIPSAKEVEKNGIEVGEMNKLLLQKVEELTLYVLELNKEIEALKE